ncbi:hypothetical protein [Salicibibacter halophilus]|uniref:hypothetical protein n=1 Tax=Salicibibacter halophilus TaxID=2502791 RepID=UPI00135911BD|nr:hypothetical protein [Salicibibacter halophilus]
MSERGKRYVELVIVSLVLITLIISFDLPQVVLATVVTVSLLGIITIEVKEYLKRSKAP